ncbi:MAG: EAL domain-containing protein, partial [Lachnospiraceae bacterium]
TPEYNHENQLVFLYVKDIQIGVVKDIENRDFLTGALNRKGFLQEAKLWLDSADSQKQYAIIRFNIKDFKGINEFFGTSGGDDVLRYVYGHFKNSPLQPVLTARTDGDRFLCLVDMDNLNYDIVTNLCKTSYVLDTRKIQLSIRCGIYLIHDKNIPVSTMCDCTKLAISHIFDEYVKPYAIFDDSMRKNYIIQSEIRGRVKDALDGGEFEVYYQPIFDTHAGNITSAEALIRWNYPKHGLLSPGIFIPILEESGQISQVDYFVLSEVRRFYAEGIRDGKKVVPISINLSWVDFYDSRMMDAIFDSLRDDSCSIKVRFEVTETAYAAMSAHEANLIAKLRAAGAEVLLDDFGSGYSSFSTFSAYDFDLIKLDMGFVQKIGKDAKIKSIIHSIIDMSHHMNAKVVAEGVETQNQLDFLYRHDCDYIQGYYFSKPLQRKEFENVLMQGRGKKDILPVKKELTLTDLISVEILQKLQDAFSDMTGMASLTTDKYGVAVTKGSNFSKFCMNHTRQSKLGKQRCEQCDKKGAEQAFQNGHSCVYECHAGLMDYAAPIMVNGEMVGCFIGGQILAEKPDREKYRRIAEELEIDPEAYLAAVDEIHVVNREKINHAANFLYVTANILSEVAYNKYTADMTNELLREKNSQLDHMANYDRLTGLSNRYHMQNQLTQFQQSGKPYCIILGDVDNFKTINDSYGHECGDIVLHRLAVLMKTNLPVGSVPSRWGGEEFLILVYGDMAYAGDAIEVVRKSIAETGISYHGKTLHVTMTFGIAFCEEREHAEKLISLADERMYHGKTHGKNQTVSQ